MLATIQSTNFCLRSKSVKLILYKTIILPLDLSGCETWSRILWEEQRLTVFDEEVAEENIWTK
jgi:hypothetical protein